MLKKAAFVVGFGAGFLVGSYMGREPFEKVQAKVTGVVEDPEVRRKVQEGTHKATSTVKEQAPVVGERAADAAKSATAKAKDKVSGGRSNTTDDSEGTANLEGSTRPVPGSTS
ncbi:hypothetical protein GWK18_01840 [Kocuria sp. JC486]|uniref:YtxH domain-containing protein n=1 Tax=Kocuria soli TaxID=2485125 RepID=A0A3N3ZQY8_9MICC|nr:MULTISPECIES: hypothetical protein [Kocuria]NHU84349.1 hypothetical protein [Kocuria sp. JC486]ROZ63685.1 hypothetical protein EDL96_04805 [Kocuria soli]